MGVSATFYTNLIILIDAIKVKTTLFNFCLLMIIAASYGISPLISQLVSLFAKIQVPNNLWAFDM